MAFLEEVEVSSHRKERTCCFGLLPDLDSIKEMLLPSARPADASAVGNGEESKQGEIVYDLLVSDAAGKAWEVGGQHGEDTKEISLSEGLSASQRSADTMVVEADSSYTDVLNSVADNAIKLLSNRRSNPTSPKGKRAARRLLDDDEDEDEGDFGYHVGDIDRTQDYVQKEDLDVPIGPVVNERNFRKSKIMGEQLSALWEDLSGEDEEEF